MATMVATLVFFACLAVASGKDMYISNNLGYTIWVGILGNSGKETPMNGGFQLDNGQQVTVSVADDWGGRVWARTGCAFDDSGNGHCVTGDCGNRLACAGAGGVPPVSLAEFTFQTGGQKDFYDVSFVDGYNVPVTISPTDQQQNPSDQYDCGTAGCRVDLNNGCPAESQQVDNGNVVACKSACETTNSDEDCCRGAFNSPDTCNPPRARYFKDRCPDAYSYAYDDRTSTYSCMNTNYAIQFSY